MPCLVSAVPLPRWKVRLVTKHDGAHMRRPLLPWVRVPPGLCQPPAAGVSAGLLLCWRTQGGLPTWPVQQRDGDSVERRVHPMRHGDSP